LKRKYSDYIAIGLTALAVIAASILIFFLLYKFESVKAAIFRLVTILMPFIAGGVIAYLLSPVHNYLCHTLNGLLSAKMKPERSRKLARMLAVLLSIALAIGLIVGLIALVVPELVTSITGLAANMPAYLNRGGEWLDSFLKNNGFTDGGITQIYGELSESLESWMRDFLPNLQGSLDSLMSGVYTGVKTAMTVVSNLVIGFIVAIYLLSDKERISASAKKLVYSLFGCETGNSLMEHVRFIDKIFGGFIQGKIVDSLLIGMLCFIGASLLGLPYTLLVSVVIGVTNVIPFFGPIIGAVPCAVLILLTDPVKCLYFIIFILALQQFDGNILGPRILGNTTGVNAFGVLFAIIFFGGLFGFVGMIVGVPLFAVISSLAEELINKRLQKKELSMDSDDYLHLDYVDQKDQRYVKRKDPTE
jgi:predicted PurR-regulated permease PerM